jgi:hypothetical protein
MRVNKTINQLEAAIALPIFRRPGTAQEHLRRRLNKDIREEDLKFPREPNIYEAFVARMQTTDDSMAAQWNADKSKLQ